MPDDDDRLWAVQYGSSATLLLNCRTVAFDDHDYLHDLAVELGRRKQDVEHRNRLGYLAEFDANLELHLTEAAKSIGGRYLGVNAQGAHEFNFCPLPAYLL